MRYLIPALAMIVAMPGHAQTTAPTKVSPGVTAPAEKVPTDVRRTTVIVRDIEASLKLYRDVIGLKVNYDAVVEMSGVALPAGEPGAKARLVLVNGNDPWIGWLGFMQWLEPDLGEAKPYPTRLSYGDIVIVMNTDHVEGRCAAAAKVPGVTMTSPPRAQQYPGRNGARPIKVKGCNFFDPDGILIELNQVQG